MAISNGTGGYQISAGNVGEPVMFAQGAPVALTAGATATPAQDAAHWAACGKTQKRSVKVKG